LEIKEILDIQSASKQKNIVLPGDRIATIEEFEAGPGTTVSSDLVVATRVGDVLREMADRKVKVVPSKQASKLPEEGDSVIGTVQSAASSVAQVRIDAINELPSYKELSGMLSLRDDRRRRSPPVRPGDTIRAKVISTKNSIYHLSLEGKENGVLHTVCSLCGGRTIALGRDRVKCTECGFVDERQLAEDYTTLSHMEG
jgi:exosome complex component CSL4